MKDENSLIGFARNAFLLKHKIDEKVGKEFGIHPIEVNIITFVYKFGDNATATHIEKEHNFKKNTISVHIDNLVKQGYLKREERENDRRAINLSLTEKSTIIARRCIKENNALKSKLFEGLSEDELEEIFRFFAIINNNAQKLLN